VREEAERAQRLEEAAARQRAKEAEARARPRCTKRRRALLCEPRPSALSPAAVSTTCERPHPQVARGLCMWRRAPAGPGA